jgi:hypothetical protein
VLRQARHHLALALRHTERVAAVLTPEGLHSSSGRQSGHRDYNWTWVHWCSIVSPCSHQGLSCHAHLP